MVSVALAGCQFHGGELTGRAADEWTRSYTLEPGGEFQIVGAVGTIDVQGGAGPAVEVKAERIALVERRHRPAGGVAHPHQ